MDTGRMDWAIKDPVKLSAERVGIGSGARIVLTARAENGDRVTIMASPERFADALMPRGLNGIPSQLDQARSLFLRDEIDVSTLEAVIERELRA